MTAESLMALLLPDTSFSSMVSFLKTGPVFNSFVSGHFWKKGAGFQLVGEENVSITACLLEFNMSHLLDGYLCH